MPNLEMDIPKSRSETAWEAFFTFIVVFFSLLAVLNLLNRVGIIPSLIWLFFVTTVVWNGSREARGLRRYLAGRVSMFAGRRFVLYPSDQVDSPRIRFGYELFGRRVFERDVEIDRIESVQWTTGQATSMAGHDMNDWNVVLWFDHCDPEKSKNRHMLAKPDQDLHIVGPSTRKQETSDFGLKFVAFLREAGARLTRGEADNVYVRPNSEEKD